jgi:hypothetical protein
MDCLNAVPTGEPHVFRNASGESCIIQLHHVARTQTWSIVACPPNYVSGHAYNLYMIPKDEAKLSAFLDKEYGIDYTWTYPSV